MTGSRAPLAIRADGGSDIGLGHIMRSAALARALVTAGQAVIWLTRTPGILPDSLAPAIDVVSLPATGNEASDLLEFLALSGCAGLIADWPSTDPDICAGIRQSGVWLALIGNHTREAAADLYIHQRFQARPAVGQTCDGSEALLLGPGYAQCPRRTVRPVPARLLVSLGGSRTRLLDQVLGALDGLPASGGMEIDIRRPSGTGQPPSEDGLRAAMLAADIGLLAAGTSLHEAAATGLPTIAVPIVANQAARALEFAACGLGLALDPAADAFEEDLRAAVTRLASTFELREQFAKAGQARVDGHGADRVAAQILSALDRASIPKSSNIARSGAGKSR